MRGMILYGSETIETGKIAGEVYVGAGIKQKRSYLENDAGG